MVYGVFRQKNQKRFSVKKKTKDGVWSFPSKKPKKVFRQKKPKKVFYFEHVKILTVK